MSLKPHAMRGLLVEATAAHVQQAEMRQLAAELAETHRHLAETQRQLAELHASTKQIIAHLSHDFRTPLAVVQDFTSLVREGLAGEVTGQQEAYLDIVADRADDLASMADELLDANKLAAGTLRMWRKPCRLTEIIAPLRANLERKARVKGIRLEWALERDLPHVYCDPDKIGRVIGSLTAAAIRGSNRGGSVEIWGAAGGDDTEVLIGVTDERPALSRENPPRGLDNFQHSSLPAREISGQRISLAADLVRLNLGEIFVESELGEGTTHWFSLPVALPMTIVQGHLDMLRREGTADDVSLIEVTMEFSTDQSNVSPVIDEFLQHESTADDLVLQAGSSRWLVLLRSSKVELESHCDHLDQQWKAFQTDSPVDLPALSLARLGTWNSKAGRTNILQHFISAELGVKQHQSSELLLLV